jgi:hypothetical protein
VLWKPALNIFAITFADRVPAKDNWFINRHLHHESDLAVSVLVSVPDLPRQAVPG